MTHAKSRIPWEIAIQPAGYSSSRVRSSLLDLARPGAIEGQQLRCDQPVTRSLAFNDPDIQMTTERARDLL
jgi:hypothetical protein